MAKYRTPKGGYYAGMPSKEYWAQRGKETLSETFKETEKVTEYFTNVFKKNLISLSKQYNELMKPFILEDGEIDIAALTKARTYDEKFIWQYKKLHNQIALFAQQMNDTEKSAITKVLSKVYKDNVVKNFSLFHKDTKSLSLLDAAAVEKAVRTPFTKDAREFSDAIWEHMDTMNKELRSTLADAVANGESIQKTSSKFKKIMGNTTYNTQRLIRTETAAIYTKASVDSYDSLGIKSLRVLSEGDECDVCGSAADDIIPVDEAEVGINIPPFHPNCKCCVIPVVDW